MSFYEKIEEEKYAFTILINYNLLGGWENSRIEMGSLEINGVIHRALSF